MRKHTLFFTAIFLTLFSNACFAVNSESSAALSEVNFSLPAPTGKFGVGRQLFFLTDEARPESGKPRPIAVWIYYPADASNRTADEPVLPAKWAEKYRAALEKRLGPAAANALLTLKTSAKTGAPAAASKELFPVLIFAPGANWLPTDYSAIIEDLTSHGYVVAAFASSPLSPFVQLSDGSIFESPRVSEETYGVASNDFRFVADRLERLNQDSSLKIRTRLDLKKVGAFGHSIGGAAAISATNNSKIAAAANLDGDFSGETTSAQPLQTIFYMTTEPPSIAGAPIEKWDEEHNEIRRKGIWEKINARSKTAYRVRAAKLFHSNFQDAAILPPASMPEKLRANRYGTIEGARGVRLTGELVRTFFDSQLKGKPAEELLKLEKQYPEIRFEIKSQK